MRRKFRVHKGRCQSCQRRVRGRHPLQTSDATGAAQSQLGPNVQASIVYLNKRAGMAYGKITDYFREANGLVFQPSTATRIVLRAADKLEPVYQDIQSSLKTSNGIVPDETGWRIGGYPVWLHTWVGDRATCYAIDPHRSADALEKVIGLDYSGFMTHDGFASYDRFVKALHQGCLDHVLRRAHHLEETQTGRHRLFPRQVINLCGEAFALRHDYRVGRADRDDLTNGYGDLGLRLRQLTARPRTSEVNDTFARHLHRYWDTWFVFLLDPDCIPASNHQAEQALRTPIVNRKVFGGNRTDAGADAQAILCSTIQTCKQQQRSPFSFLRDAVCGLAQTLFQLVAPSHPDRKSTRLNSSHRT